ncbi:A/G-specific adenine glycosylase [Pseudoflavitalea sp. G-6-1-2]|uniref:A/G-specific adenine glycosylase n=1 Tax=Pseudoflavitalea sp. G-6-1-2 TaxID=2728841 RepID=UPI00146DD0A6|nr:A/G-specific adenine glycosylase [Pseudoflavitalea sp. G-6-1-2]NML20340.1 A/G-specific adenine glycosylase [Pseudoflavitalea sp. G-6-1-2]
MKADFTRKLLQWNKESNTRSMPWKGERDPYKIWLSEIILQQTRVEQGLAYYHKFIENFPTVHDLANAPEQEVFKCWEGLGYYSRCKNLIASAKKISQELKGVFPSTYDTIKELKGIGPYTAAAISSFAFNENRAVVDGNVQRVISRYFGISTPIDTTAGKKLYQELAQALIDPSQPAIYNQAIMDFGAVICKPQLPLCATCIQNPECEAYKHNLVKQLPVKEKTLVKSTRWLYYFIIVSEGCMYIRQRTGRDIWENLHEFVLLEAEGPIDTAFQDLPFLKDLLHDNPFTVQHISKMYKQQLTHQTINGQFITVHASKPLPDNSGYFSVAQAQLAAYPFPKFINMYLQETSSPARLF